MIIAIMDLHERNTLLRAELPLFRVPDPLPRIVVILALVLKSNGASRIESVKLHSAQEGWRFSFH